MNTEYLSNWDTIAEQRKADFMEHMYKCSGRTNGLYTGLWQDFCLNEAGSYCRNLFFERQAAIQEFVKLQKEKDKEITTVANDDFSACAPEPFVPEFHD